MEKIEIETAITIEGFERWLASRYPTLFKGFPITDDSFYHNFNRNIDIFALIDAINSTQITFDDLFIDIAKYIEAHEHLHDFWLL